MVKYIVLHNKHEGCYDFRCYQDEVARIRLTSITINPPKLFMFNTREEAQDFFEDYINDVDCIDIKCKQGDDVEHIEYCTCGIIELDESGEPILFYNKKNQIFLLEHGPQVFLPHQELKNDVKNMNLTNKLIRKCRTLGREQRKKYIELGKYCEDCNNGKLSDFMDENDIEKEEHKNENEYKESDKEKNTNNNVVINLKVETIPMPPTTSTPNNIQVPPLIIPLIPDPKVVKEPKVKEPKVKEPKVKEPNVKEPNVKEPNVKEPKVKEPKVKEPKEKEPKVKEPKAT